MVGFLVPCQDPTVGNVQLRRGARGEHHNIRFSLAHSGGAAGGLWLTRRRKKKGLVQKG